MSNLVGREAINFIAPAVMPNNTMVEDFDLWNYLVNGEMCVLFFYPLDFTFVCPSEIIALNAVLKELNARNTLPVLVSVDSQFTHLAYKNTPLKKGGLGDIQIPMVSDIKKEIAKGYGVLHNDSVALRATFIMDKSKIIRHQTTNDLPIGRSVDETLRIIDAIRHNEKYGEVCPANWHVGQKAMEPTTSGVIKYFSSN